MKTTIPLLFAVIGLMLSAGVAQADEASAKTNYDTLCASCHGATGAGDGAAAEALDPKPANFTDKAKMAKVGDDDLFKTIKEGGPATGKSPLMAPFGALMDDAAINDMVAFIKKLSK